MPSQAGVALSGLLAILLASHGDDSVRMLAPVGDEALRLVPGGAQVALGQVAGLSRLGHPGRVPGVLDVRGIVRRSSDSSWRTHRPIRVVVSRRSMGRPVGTT